MKFLKKSIYALSLVSLVGLWSCSSDGLLQESELAHNGKQVRLTMTVNKSKAQTRTIFEENTVSGGLTDAWVEGDILHVYNASGVEVGTLDLQESLEPSVGVFSGLVNLEQGEQEVNLWYYNINDNVNVGTYTGSNVLKIDLHKQSYSDLEALSAMDVLSKRVTLNVKGEETTVVQDETMEANLAFARFTLTGIPEGTKGTLNIYDTNDIKVSKGEIVYDTYNTLNLYLGNPSQSPAISSDRKDLIVNSVEAGKDVYVALLPYKKSEKSYKLGFTFTAENGDSYTYAFKNATVIEPGVYYCAFVKNENEENGTVSGIELPMLSASNPGLIDNWGGPVSILEPSYTDTKEVMAKYKGNGWCNNQYSIYTDDAWCDPIIYHSNGMVNGALYSTRNASPSYYQWGRWMGFPYNDNLLIINSFGQPVNNYWAMDNAFALGESVKDNPRVKYQNTQYGSVYGGYFALMATNWLYSGGWTNEMAKKSSIIFGGAESQTSGWQDYLKSSDALAGNCSWTDRVGNPCPDGWRIPNLTELITLIPGGENKTVTITDSYAEVRVVNGVKCAFCYKVTKNDEGVPCLNITSVETTKDDVSANDKIFEGNKFISIGAYGIINFEGAREFYKERAYVWSCESGTGGNLTGYAGKALRLIFSNNKVTISTTMSDRINGASVIPVRDASAKHTDLRPWFPYSAL